MPGTGGGSAADSEQPSARRAASVRRGPYGKTVCGGNGTDRNLVEVVGRQWRVAPQPFTTFLHCRALAETCSELPVVDMSMTSLQVHASEQSDEVASRRICFLWQVRIGLRLM